MKRKKADNPEVAYHAVAVEDETATLSLARAFDSLFEATLKRTEREPHNCGKVHIDSYAQLGVACGHARIPDTERNGEILPRASSDS